MKQGEFEIVEKLSVEYSIKSLCEVMSISKSGYYKWLNRKNNPNRHTQNRRELANVIIGIHNRKPSYGYHRIRALIIRETGWVVSANMVHRICKALKVHSKAKHYRRRCTGRDESIKYQNIVNGQWSASRPFEIVASDTTSIRFKGIEYDWNYYIDVLDSSIIGSDVKPFCHGSNPLNHKLALEEMLNNKTERGYRAQPTILHSDQGAIYSSVMFNRIHKDHGVIRSMSRIATPTDNPLIEAKNGWLKQEIKVDFNQMAYDTVEEYIAAIIMDHNHFRPSYALNYKTPIEYRTLLGFD